VIDVGNPAVQSNTVLASSEWEPWFPHNDPRKTVFEGCRAKIFWVDDKVGVNIDVTESPVQFDGSYALREVDSGVKLGRNEKSPCRVNITPLAVLLFGPQCAAFNGKCRWRDTLRYRW
jgi:hypothetical protein